MRPAPRLAFAAGGPQMQLATRAAAGSCASTRVDADTLIWLRFSPRAYLRDWLAGWLDTLLNGAAGSRRRAYRARLADVARACLAALQSDAVDARQFDALRPHVLFLEFSSPDQALFWLEMQEERVRETEPPRL
ncbi:MAG TPA: hypothetical protein VMG60_05190 [Burkholderiaceae bacterium]|nr:hypothetical protein [Burkholderiaceae bacterium]